MTSRFVSRLVDPIYQKASLSNGREVFFRILFSRIKPFFQGRDGSAEKTPWASVHNGITLEKAVCWKDLKAILVNLSGTLDVEADVR